MEKKYKKIYAVFVAILTCLALFVSIYYYNLKALHDESRIMVEWNRFALDIETNTEGIAVPVSARFFGYMGFIGLEAYAGKFNNFTFLQENFPELNTDHLNNNGDVDLSLILNSAYYVFISKYYINIPVRLQKKGEGIYNKWVRHCRRKISNEEVFVKSNLLGKKIGESLYEWSSRDYLGHQAYLHNYDRNYESPKGEGKWQVDEEHPMPALLPYWGNVCPFVINTTDYLAKPLPPISNDHTSIYYKQALELFTVSTPLSYENKWIAEFWSDDVRGLTFTPAGRWISILCQIIEQENVDIDKTIEAFFKVGIAQHDAIVACWNSKYHYNLARPQSMIRKNIHDAWRSFHPSPNFPSYPSGHSVLSGVNGELLTKLFGAQIEFTDNSHKDRIEFLSTPRTFQSFQEMAAENAYSRIPLGVHYRMDCQEGLQLGSEVAKEINKLVIFPGKKMANHEKVSSKSNI